MSQKQTHTFQTEVSQLLDLMINSLYSNKEIFLRELISNSSDAIDKLRFESIKDDNLVKGKKEFSIYVNVDKKAGQITIIDNGIGMNEEEVVNNIGTIANSGTKKFLKTLDENQAKNSNLIGQFGVGFYSAFIISDKVTLISRKAGDDESKSTKWVSQGKGKYTIENVESANYGTTIILDVKKSKSEFLENFRLKNIISKYSNNITVPIMMLKDSKEDKKNEKEYETINEAKAFWAKDKKTLKKEDYNNFYKSLTYDFQEPLSYIHNRVEGKLEYTSLFFIPSKAPFDMWDPKRKGGVKLYAKRVFIMEGNESLLPQYLRFIKGVVDSADLSLNISREILQGSNVIGKIKKASVKRILSDLEKMHKNNPADYDSFWKEFGMVVKEGIVEDPANKDKISELLRFATTHNQTAEQNVSLSDYISRKKDEQKSIYYITADNFNAAKGSPHLEIFKEKGIEVLLLTDRIDEWLVSNFGKYKELDFKSIAKGGLDDIENEDSKTEKEKIAKNFTKVIEKSEKILKDKVKAVKISSRLNKSPSCLVADENELGSNMERIMKSLGQKVPETKPILEINPKHNLIKKLQKSFDDDLIKVLFDQAILSEGGQIKEPAEFVKRINKLMS